MRKYLSLIISAIILLGVAAAIWLNQGVPSLRQGEAGVSGGNDRRLQQTESDSTVGTGEFSLIDANENAVSQKILQGGKFSLVYFGFTSCPHVCPTTLANMTLALERIGDNADKIQPMFISVDPDRDTPAVIKEYIADFHPTFIALTGSKEEVKQATEAFKVYYQAEKSKSDADYNVNHSDFIYLMSPEGDYITYFTQEDSAEEMSVELLRNVR
jgi:protein SCO1